MKHYSLLAIGAALLAALPTAQAESRADPAERPCLRVTVQNERVNESSVAQQCDWNISRTVQAGARNTAQTLQMGRVNDNKVRQYQYDPPPGFDRRRGD